MQNNTPNAASSTNPDTKPPKKKYRNVALQSNIFASYQDPTKPSVPPQQRTVNTQTHLRVVGVPSSTSTSDLRATTGPLQKINSGPVPPPPPPGVTPGNPAPPAGIPVIGSPKPPPPNPNPTGQPPLTSVGVGSGRMQPRPLPIGQPAVGVGSGQVQQLGQPALTSVGVGSGQVQQLGQPALTSVGVGSGQVQPQPLPTSRIQNQQLTRIPLQNTNAPVGIAAGGDSAAARQSPDNRLIGNWQFIQNQNNNQPQQLTNVANNNDLFDTLLCAFDEKLGLLQSLNTLFEDVHPKCPEGLEVLLDTENIFVQYADADFEETFFNIHNKYDVLNTFGERIYFSGETLNTLARPNCAGAQKFRLSVIGCHGGEVFQLRGKNFTAVLRNRNKESIGSISTCYQWCDNYPSYRIKDDRGKILYYLYHEMGNSNTYDYEVFDQNKGRVGRLSKTWIGLPYPDPDLPYSYGISFPTETDVRNKALLMGALFVAFFQFFEDTQRERRYNRDACCATVVLAVLFIFLLVGLAFLAAYIVMG